MNKLVRERNRGFVLASALILLVSLTLIAVTIAYRNTLDEMMAANQRDYVNAMGVAESGIEAAFAKIKHNQGGNYVDLASQVFGADLLALANPYDGDAQNTLLPSTSVSGGNYVVRVLPATDTTGNPAIILNSIGTVNGAEREIEIVLEMQPYGTAQYAILTQDDIYKISGNPVITGPYADVHTNADMWISGNPIIAGSVTASGEVYEGANEPGVANGVQEVEYTVQVPHIYPLDWDQYATIRFTNDCRVLNAVTNQQLANASSGKWHGWDCSPGDKWTMSTSESSDMYDAFYYVEGNVIISGSPESFWWNASIVAEGYIEVSGNPWIRPWGNPDTGNDTGNAAANEILFLAGNDLKINGNANQQFQGLMATHMQIDVSGNPNLEGTIIAENGAGQEITTGQTAKNIADNNSFSGDMHLVASGSAMFGGGKKLTVTAWRELVN